MQWPSATRHTAACPLLPPRPCLPAPGFLPGPACLLHTCMTPAAELSSPPSSARTAADRRWAFQLLGRQPGPHRRQCPALPLEARLHFPGREAAGSSGCLPAVAWAPAAELGWAAWWARGGRVGSRRHGDLGGEGPAGRPCCPSASSATPPASRAAPPPAAPGQRTPAQTRHRPALPPPLLPAAAAVVQLMGGGLLGRAHRGAGAAGQAAGGPGCCVAPAAAPARWCSLPQEAAGRPAAPPAGPRPWASSPTPPSPSRTAAAAGCAARIPRSTGAGLSALHTPAGWLRGVQGVQQ